MVFQIPVTTRPFRFRLLVERFSSHKALVRTECQLNQEPGGPNDALRIFRQVLRKHSSSTLTRCPRDSLLPLRGLRVSGLARPVRGVRKTEGTGQTRASASSERTNITASWWTRP